MLHLVDDEIPMPVGGSLPFAPNHALQGGGGAGSGSGSGGGGALGLGASPLNVDSAAESRRALAESARLLHSLNRQQAASAANANRSTHGHGSATGSKRRPQSAPAARRQKSGAERLIEATEARKRQRRLRGGR